MYIFKNWAGTTLYVGKAKNLAARVSSYFHSPVKLGPKTAALVGQISSVDHIEVQSEIEALLLESRLIKRWLPPYNIASRDDKSPYYIHITAQKWPKPHVSHQSQGAIAGPFLNGQTTKSILRQLRRVAPYHTESPCFYRHLGLCRPCPDDPATTKQDYLANISRLRRLLRGQFKPVFRQAIKSLDFETAALLRHLLSRPVSANEYLVNPNLVTDRQREAIQALQAALQTPSLRRIEVYDVANLSGTAATAAMTVAVDGEINSKNFRHFTIKTKSTPDDVAMLKEVLSRRLKRADWPKPDLIVLDGGKPQLSALTHNPALPDPCAFVALAKKEEVIYTPDGREIRLPRRHPGLQLLQQLRDEAHRFSRRLHHKHRRII